MFEYTMTGSTWWITAVVIILDVIALIQVWRSGFGALAKIAWTALVVLFPILGAVAWFICWVVVSLLRRARAGSTI
ncbi:PLDc N-terminal domain-containing protein [Curtobacterium sp. AB7]|uniref:PLDc N-terminal domain-containing protein n=1 Tax=Curtobacterium sp. AB7 TaxID=3349327 RepID=UPI0038381AE7